MSFSAAFSHHRTSLGLALRRLASAPLNTLLSLLAIGVALALPAGGFVLLGGVQQVVRQAAPSARISLYLALDAERKAATDLAGRLKGNGAIRSVQFMPREETLARMKKSPGLADVIDALPGNPFPDAFSLEPADDSPAATEALAAELRRLPKVDHVQLDSAWVRRLDALLRLGRTGLVLLATLLGIGLVAITFNTIRLQVLTQRAEIEVSRLLGATDTFIRRPFHYYGALQGLGGGLVAWAIVALACAGLQGPINELAQLYGLGFGMPWPGPSQGVILLAVSALLGWLGAALSLQQHLRKLL